MKMYLVRLRGNGAPVLMKSIRRKLCMAHNESEYTKTPEYPPIIDLSLKARKWREVMNWHEKIKKLRTVEEKLFEINIPRYYGWPCLVLEEGVIPYNSLKFLQYATRTHLIEVGNLPKHDTGDVETCASELCDALKSQIEDALIFEMCETRRYHDILTEEDDYITPGNVENIVATSVISQINNVILSTLAGRYPHLLKAQLDYKPRLESFWFLGGLPPPEPVRMSKMGHEWQKDMANDPVDRAFQYVGKPALQLRSDLPLPPLLDLAECRSSDFEVPRFDFDPCVLGFVNKGRRHGTNIPGFWPGDDCEFGLLSFHTRGNMLERPAHYGEEEHQEAIHAQGILASYGWLLPQACYQGFSTFNEVTYPLVTQTVITNGRLWSFYTYQLNTTLLHAHFATENERCNICWATKPMALYERIENGKLVGFNPDVLKTLLKFYTRVPQHRDGVELKPFLDRSVLHVAGMQRKGRREWWESQFKYMYSGRPRHRLPYEVYLWEKIYKIDHKTRPFDKRTRPFELPDVNPYVRRYDDHPPKYMPRKLRPPGREKGFRRINFYKTYYNK